MPGNARNSEASPLIIHQTGWVINVVSMSRAIRDRLRSFGLRFCGMRGSVARGTADGCSLFAARHIESAQLPTTEFWVAAANLLLARR